MAPATPQQGFEEGKPAAPKKRVQRTPKPVPVRHHNYPNTGKTSRTPVTPCLQAIVYSSGRRDTPSFSPALQHQCPQPQTSKKCRTNPTERYGAGSGCLTTTKKTISAHQPAGHQPGVSQDQEKGTISIAYSSGRRDTPSFSPALQHQCPQPQTSNKFRTNPTECYGAGSGCLTTTEKSILRATVNFDCL